MPKAKTHKATAKRFTVTKSNKLKHRKPGQDHFNARANGDATRDKRRDQVANDCFTKTVKILMN